MKVETNAEKNPHGFFDTTFPTKWEISDVGKDNLDAYPLCDEMAEHIFNRIRDACHGVGVNLGSLGELLYDTFRKPTADYLEKTLSRNAFVFVKGAYLRRLAEEEAE